MAAVFGAREVERHEASGRRAAHVELTIGDGVVVVEAGELPPEHKPTEASVYVYVEDVDAVYERAVEAGALYTPFMEKRYEEAVTCYDQPLVLDRRFYGRTVNWLKRFLCGRPDVRSAKYLNKPLFQKVFLGQ